MQMNEPQGFATRLHSLTDLVRILAMIVAQTPEKEIIITREMMQDYGQEELYIESGFTTDNVRLTTRRLRR